MAMATGELIVIAAGDDISLPHRTETLVAEWLRAEKPSGIASAVNPMDEGGKIQPASSLPVPPNPRYESTSREYKLRQFAQQGEFCLTGCAAAWSRENWNFFGNLMDGVVNEDGVLSFRAILDRGIRFVPEPLVLYRRHENNAWNTALPGGKFTAEYYRLSEITAARRAPLLEKMYRNSLSDLKTAASRQLLDAVTAQRVDRDLTSSLRQKALQPHWWDLSFPRRLLRLADSPHRRFPLNLTSLLPLNWHAAFRSLLARLKNSGSKILAAGSSPHS